MKIDLWNFEGEQIIVFVLRINRELFIIKCRLHTNYILKKNIFFQRYNSSFRYSMTRLEVLYLSNLITHECKIMTKTILLRTYIILLLYLFTYITKIYITLLLIFVILVKKKLKKLLRLFRLFRIRFGWFLTSPEPGDVREKDCKRTGRTGRTGGLTNWRTDGLKDWQTGNVQILVYIKSNCVLSKIR